MAKYGSFKYNTNVYGKTVEVGKASILSYNAIISGTKKAFSKSKVFASSKVQSFKTYLHNVGGNILDISSDYYILANKKIVSSIRLVKDLKFINKFIAYVGNNRAAISSLLAKTSYKINTSIINISKTINRNVNFLKSVGNDFIAVISDIALKIGKEVKRSVYISKTFARITSLSIRIFSNLSSYNELSKGFFVDIFTDAKILSSKLLKLIEKTVGYTPFATYGSFKYGEKKYNKGSWIKGKLNKRSYKTMGKTILVMGAVLRAFPVLLISLVIITGSLVAMAIKVITSFFVSTGKITKNIFKNIVSSLNMDGLATKFLEKVSSSTLIVYGGAVKTLDKVVGFSIVSIFGNVGKFISKKIKRFLDIFKRLSKYWDLFPEVWLEDYPITLEYSCCEVKTHVLDDIIKLEVVGMPYAGSTITLKGRFPDSAGNLTELEDVKVRVFAPSQVLLAEIPASMVSEGEYMVTYTIPEDKFGQFDYEFSGVLGEKTIIGRSSFNSKWK